MEFNSEYKDWQGFTTKEQSEGLNGWKIAKSRHQRYRESCSTDLTGLLLRHGDVDLARKGKVKV